MKSIILAAGEGTRLRPYTLNRPKCLVEIDGESLIDRQLKILTLEGIKEVIVIGGFLYEMLDNRGSKQMLNPRYDETNMVWTLFCAEDELHGDVIVSYGDIVYSGKVLRTLLDHEADIAVVVDTEWESYWRERMDDPLSDAETLKLSSDGSILELGRKPETLDEIEGQYIGLMKFSAKGVSLLKSLFHEVKKAGKLGGKAVENAYMTDMLQYMIDSGYRVDAVPVHGEWIEVDTVDDLENPVTRKRLSEIVS